jgi:hypothetical protein
MSRPTTSPATTAPTTTTHVLNPYQLYLDPGSHADEDTHAVPSGLDVSEGTIVQPEAPSPTAPLQIDVSSSQGEFE